MAADMAILTFRLPAGGQAAGPEWRLQLPCSWRLESDAGIYTGSFDWNEPSREPVEPGGEWHPLQGVSLLVERLKSLLIPPEVAPQPPDPVAIHVTRQSGFVVAAVELSNYGELVLQFANQIRLRTFSSGSRGEAWVVFERGKPDLGLSFELSEVATEPSEVATRPDGD
jgi:hypothetical protein